MRVSIISRPSGRRVSGFEFVCHMRKRRSQNTAPVPGTAQLQTVSSQRRDVGSVLTPRVELPRYSEAIGSGELYVTRLALALQRALAPYEKLTYVPSKRISNAALQGAS